MHLMRVRFHLTYQRKNVYSTYAVVNTYTTVDGFFVFFGSLIFKQCPHLVCSINATFQPLMM